LGNRLFESKLPRLRARHIGQRQAVHHSLTASNRADSGEQAKSRGDNATKPFGQYALYLLGRFPKELGVLKCLAGDKHVNAVGFELAPVIRVVNN
jgi:hypothetical protein